MNERKNLTFNDVAVGQEIPPLKKEVYKLLPIVYSGAVVNFLPIHVDDEAAKAVGLGGVVLQGVCVMSFVSQMITDWCHDPGLLKELKGRFLQFARAGDTITARGKVIEKKADAEKGKIICEVWAENQGGEVVMGKGLALVELPLKV